MDFQKVSLEINGNCVTQELIQKVSLENSKLMVTQELIQKVSLTYHFTFFWSKFVADNILRQQCTYQTGHGMLIVNLFANSSAKF